jgi:hypothetical protein
MNEQIDVDYSFLYSNMSSKAFAQTLGLTLITGFIVITKSNLQIQEPLCQFVILEIETSGFF